MQRKPSETYPELSLASRSLSHNHSVGWSVAFLMFLQQTKIPKVDFLIDHKLYMNHPTAIEHIEVPPYVYLSFLSDIVLNLVFPENIKNMSDIVLNLVFPENIKHINKMCRASVLKWLPTRHLPTYIYGHMFDSQLGFLIATRTLSKIAGFHRHFHIES